MIDALVFGADAVEGYDDIEAARDADETTWVRATEATQAELDRVAETFGIHSLTVEDVHNNVRSKTEEFPDYSFALLILPAIIPWRISEPRSAEYFHEVIAGSMRRITVPLYRDDRTTACDRCGTGVQ